MLLLSSFSSSSLCNDRATGKVLSIIHFILEATTCFGDYDQWIERGGFWISSCIKDSWATWLPYMVFIHYSSDSSSELGMNEFDNNVKYKFQRRSGWKTHCQALLKTQSLRPTIPHLYSSLLAYRLYQTQYKLPRSLPSSSAATAEGGSTHLEIMMREKGDLISEPFAERA